MRGRILKDNRTVQLEIGKLYSIGSCVLKIKEYKKPYYKFVYVKRRHFVQPSDFHEASEFAMDLKEIPKLKAKLYE
jgi:hypothetical protein